MRENFPWIPDKLWPALEAFAKAFGPEEKPIVGIHVYRTEFGAYWLNIYELPTKSGTPSKIDLMAILAVFDGWREGKVEAAARFHEKKFQGITRLPIGFSGHISGLEVDLHFAPDMMRESKALLLFDVVDGTWTETGAELEEGLDGDGADEDDTFFSKPLDDGSPSGHPASPN